MTKEERMWNDLHRTISERIVRLEELVIQAREELDMIERLAPAEVMRLYRHLTRDSK